jgi:carboxymethylenebutenolidase
MGRALAKEGYTVLVPNPFYRVVREAGLEYKSFDFGNTTDRGKLNQLMGSVTAEGAAERDALAFIAWLDQQKEVNKAKKIGTQGYCMGGPLVVRTAASSDRIGAGGSFHGGGLVTNNPNSPHLLAPKIHAQMYFGIAKNDDAQQPDAKDKLKEAMAAAKVTAEIEVYPSQHGWCMSDFVAPPTPIYDKPQAERAWGKLLALYKAALA